MSNIDTVINRYTIHSENNIHNRDIMHTRDTINNTSSSSSPSFLAIVAVILVIGIILYTFKRKDTLGKGEPMANERAIQERHREQEAKEKENKEKAQAIIRDLSETYEKEYYRYAVHDNAYSMGLDLDTREELKKLFNTRDTCPAFAISSTCQSKGIAPSLVVGAINEYLKKEWNKTADDPRIPATTLEKLIQERAQKRAVEDINAFLKKQQNA